MADIKERIEIWFEGFARLIYRRRWLTMVIMAALIAALSSGIPGLTIDTSTEGFLHEDDPALKTYYEFRDRFGRDDVIIVAVEAKDLFSQTALKKLKALHKDLEDNVPNLDEITSLINVRNTRGEADRLVVEDLLEKWPRSEAELAVLKERVLTNPLYLNQFISQDGRFTAIILEIDAYSNQGRSDDLMAGLDETGEGEETAGEPVPLTDEESRATVAAVRSIVAKYRADDFNIWVAGSPVVTAEIKRSMIRDMGLFMRLAVIVIGLCLFLTFRRVSGVLFPLIIVALALTSTVGLMGRLGVAIKSPTMVLPSFILAVGVGAAVHILALFYQALQKNGGRQEEAIVEALGHSGLAVVMTSLTTAAGLASFSTAEVAPIADLGVFASLGVLLALVYTLVLLPALLAIFPIKPKRVKPGRSHDALFDRILDRITDFSTGHAKAIVAVSAVVIVLSIIGAAQNKFSHDALKWLPEDMPARRATVKIDDKLRGSIVAEIVVDTGKENGLYDPIVLKKLDKLAQDLAGLEQGEIFVGKAWSIADMLKEIHQALNENRPEFYAIPDNAALIPQEFLLFENSGSDDLEKVTDSQFRLARFTVKFPWTDVMVAVPFLNEIEARFQAELGDRAEITITGIMVIMARTLGAAIHSAAKSYIIAFVVITLMMILLIGRLKLGLIAMLPNLAPILMTIALMGWFKFPFDMFTMLVGSIAIGLAVDDTVHFMHNFRRYFAETGDAVESIRRTLHTAGRAMLVTSVVLATGFFIFMFASMNNVFYFGLLTGTAVLLALLADFIMAPALMVLFKPDGRPAAKK